MKRNKVIIALVAALMVVTGLIMTRCTDALKDVQITVNSKVFKYTTLFEVSGSSGADMQDATVTLTGEDASRIFNMNGYQDFKISGGVLAFAVDPNNLPTEDHPVAFNVIIKKSGYSTVNIPVEITIADSSAMHYVVMINRASPPTGVESKSNTLKLQNGKVIKDTVIYVGPGTCTCTTGKTTVGLKAGTAFKTGDGTILGSELSSIQITSLYVETSSNDALQVFPGGDLTQKKVQVEGGEFQAGTLLPAGLIELSMTGAGKEIKGFTTPIDITIRLNPDYINPETKDPVKAGDQLKVFSYSTDKGYFQFETEATVEDLGGNLSVHFPVDHLSWFMVGDFIKACNSSIATVLSNNAAMVSLAFKIQAAWLATGVTTPVTIKVYSTKDGGTNPDLLIYTLSGTIMDGQQLATSIIPGMPIIIKVFDAFGNQMFSGNVSDPCSLATTLGSEGGVDLPLNQTDATSNAKTTMQLYVRCPNNKNPITVLPTFYLYFKDAGASDDTYKLVGMVTNGYITTNLLSVNKRYDFKAIWGNTVKVVHDKSVLADNTATVGDNQGAGELIGTKAGATNLEMLKENCDGLL